MAILVILITINCNQLESFTKQTEYILPNTLNYITISCQSSKHNFLSSLVSYFATHTIILCSKWGLLPHKIRPVSNKWNSQLHKNVKNRRRLQCYNKTRNERRRKMKRNTEKRKKSSKKDRVHSNSFSIILNVKKGRIRFTLDGRIRHLLLHFGR